MERGLLWLPLLAVFIWLAWAGRNEFRKVEAYQQWAQQYERAKYDIFAVLGQSGPLLTWGVPTRSGPVALKTLSLADVSHLQLEADGKPVEALEGPLPKARRSAVVLMLANGQSEAIPFTDIDLAIQWLNYLRRQLQTLQSASN